MRFQAAPAEKVTSVIQRSMSAPSIAIACGDQSFPVPVTVLLERSYLFKEDLALLASPQYQVRSSCDALSYLEFLKAIQRQVYSLNRSTLEGLESLSNEFGVPDVQSACRSFRERMGCCRVDTTSDVCAELAWKLGAIEERQVAVEHQLAIQDLEVLSLSRTTDFEQKNAALERLVSDHGADLDRIQAANSRLLNEFPRLLDSVSALEGRLGELERNLEGEQAYRRGCEYYYGTNGYGLRGEDISKKFGVIELRRAADLGHADAQYVVGRILRASASADGLLLAARYMKQSADQGNSYGESGYARALYFGEGTARDPKLAFEYYQRSAAHENARGQNGCGYCLEEGTVRPRDLSGAAGFYKIAAEQENAGAMNNYGLCLRDGNGVQRDDAAAFKFFKLSAEQGEPNGLANYGLCLENGFGAKKDVVEAAKCFRASAELGNSYGQRLFARCLENGIGVTRDAAKAAVYYKLSADQGDAEARAAHERCSSRLFDRLLKSRSKE
jgi:TPR repeat protein